METSAQAWIYESPDGGRTVYRRPMTGDWTTRELSSQDQQYLRDLKIGLKTEQWRDIIIAAETDPVLADLLDRAQCYYQLKHA